MKTRHLAATIALIPSTLSLGATRYIIGAIPLTAGATDSLSFQISDSGYAIGTAFSSANSSGTGFRYGAGTVTPIPIGPAAINNAGQVVGGNVFWSAGSVTMLQAPVGDYPGEQFARSINDAGQILGDSFVLASTVPVPVFGTSHVVIWTSGVPQALGTLPGYDASSAGGINSSGVVAASAWCYNIANAGPGQAFTYKDGAISPLPTPDGSYSIAGGINDSGEVIGTYGPAFSNQTFPVLWKDRSLIPLAPYLNLPTIPEAISNTGTIVGVASDQLDSYAVIWDQDLNLVDLQTLIPADSGWKLRGATGINSSGNIVGFGIYNGAERAFLLTPDASAITTPEPSSIAFLGLPWLLLRRNRRRVLIAS